MLLLRGARQVGKTYAIRTLGKTFRHVVEVNFEELPSAKVFFDGDLSARPICEKLAGFVGTPITAGETLLFFDEIQACPRCISALRFFKEQMPRLHVAAAGSLLEFALGDIPSFGVGRISSMFMHPLSFTEFVHAVEGELLAGVLRGLKPSRPVEAPFHSRFLDLFRTYLMTGGLPQAVETYARQRDLRGVQAVISSMVTTCQDDFSKYGGRVPPGRLAETLDSVARQAGGKFVYSSVSPGIAHQQARHCIELLEKAGLVLRVTHTSARGIPLGAQIDTRKFKAQIFDCGVHQRLLGLDMAQHLVADTARLVNRGSLAEVFVGFELAANASPLSRPALYYWHREARASTAEVDFVIQKGSRIIPLEVKSGMQGGMKSMRLFLEERGLPLGIRLSQENFARFGTIMTMPVYAAGLLASDGFELPE